MCFLVVRAQHAKLVLLRVVHPMAGIVEEDLLDLLAIERTEEAAYPFLHVCCLRVFRDGEELLELPRGLKEAQHTQRVILGRWHGFQHM